MEHLLLESLIGINCSSTGSIIYRIAMLFLYHIIISYVLDRLFYRHYLLLDFNRLTTMPNPISILIFSLIVYTNKESRIFNDSLNCENSLLTLYISKVITNSYL